MMKTKNRHGFTLIELMIVIAIIGIIAAIGYPSYVNYLNRSARGEATAKLLEVMERQEQYYRRNVQYTTDLTLLQYPLAASVTTDSGRHSIAASSCGGNRRIRCVLLTATGQNQSDGDTPLTLNSQGTKNF